MGQWHARRLSYWRTCALGSTRVARTTRATRIRRSPRRASSAAGRGSTFRVTLTMRIRAATPNTRTSTIAGAGRLAMSPGCCSRRRALRRAGAASMAATRTPAATRLVQHGGELPEAAVPGRVQFEHHRWSHADLVPSAGETAAGVELCDGQVLLQWLRP